MGRLALILLAVVLAPVLPGCGVDLYSDEPADTVHLGLTVEIGGLDPAQCQESVCSTCCLQIYDTLYEYHHLKRPYVLKPCLAHGPPRVSMPGLVHTIRLKEGVLFQDDPCFEGGTGREVTAEDVVFSWKRLMDAHTASPGTWIFDGYVEGFDEFQQASASKPKYRTRYEEVAGLRALDRYTLQIRLKKPYPQLHWVLAMSYAAVVPWEAIAAYGDEFLNHPVGTGPFVVESFQRNQRLILGRNPTYRDERYPSEGEPEDRAFGRLDDAGKRLPLADRLVFTIYKEPQPRWLAFLHGQLDRTGIPKDQFDTAVDPATRELRADLAGQGIRLEKTPAIEVIYDAFNLRDPILGTPNGERGRAIRRAMSLAFHEEWARTKLYNDRVDPVQGLLVPEFPEYDPDFENPWKRQLGETREDACARAQKILADAGYPGGKGIGPLYYDVTDSVVDSQFYGAFRRDMADIGIDLRATRVTWNQMVTRVDQGDAQVWGMSWTADYPDAQNFFMLFYGPNKAPGPNGSSYENPAFDRFYEKTLALPPCEERTKLYRKMQRIIVDDCVWIFKYRRVTYDLMRPWLHNFKRSAMQDRYGKYLRVDAEDRREFLDATDKPVLLPVWIALAVVVVVVGATLIGARKRVRAW